MPTLEERVARIEARNEIGDLVARYFLATDDDDYAGLGECFTEDAKFSASGFAGGIGRQPIIEFLREARSGMGQTVHTPHHVYIDQLDGDCAAGVVTAHLELGLGDTTVLAAVRYYDSYRFESGKWRIAERSMKAVYVSRWSHLDQSLVTGENICWPGSPAGSTDLPRKYS